MSGILLDAMDGKTVSRAPVMAKIWIDLAAKIMERDWISLFQDPALAASTVVEAAIKAENDGARVFCLQREISGGKQMVATSGGMAGVLAGLTSRRRRYTVRKTRRF